MTVLHSEAFLFDSDGVVVDSDHTVERAWGAWSRRYELDADEVVRLAHGTPSRQTVTRLVAEPHRAEAQAMIDRLELELADEVRALPGAVELLSTLAPGTWTIVTSGNAQLAGARLRAAGIPLPEALVTADDVTRGKPHPEPYLTGAARLGRPAGVCAVFEDSSAGVAAARAAAVREVVGVSRHNDGVDLFVRDLRSVTVEGGSLRVAAERLPEQDPLP